MSIFKLPDLGEGLPEAEIVEWFIKEGDVVGADQIVVSMETAKAIVEIPSPQSGKIVKLYGDAGDIIHTGDPLLEFAAKEIKRTAEAKSGTINESIITADFKTADQESSSVVGELRQKEEVLKETAESVSHGHVGIKATPAVRALARRHNIDLSIVTPSGPDGTIKASDVERVVKIFDEVGRLKPLKGVRRAMARSMAQAHEEVVAVTINDDADITLWAGQFDITVRLIRAMVKACEEEPALNSWYDSHSIGRRLIKQVHLGLALDTKDGLFVPVIRNVGTYDKKTLREKISLIEALVENRKIPPEELRGNTITLSNFGGMGGKYANPVVVPPTVAILGAGRIFPQVMMASGEGDGDKLTQHRMIPLSFTFDHRSVTGGEAARFLQALIKDLEQAT